MSAVASYARVEKLIWKMAGRALVRLTAAGARQIDREDIVQELSVAWVKAAESFDAARGVPFVAYFVRGAWMHINRWAEAIEEELRNVGPSIDAELSGDEGSGSLSDLIADRNGVAADLLVERAEIRALAYRKLSPVAAKFLELLESPPPALYRQIAAIETRAEVARARGAVAWAPHHLTLPLIADAMGLGKTERRRVYAELNDLADYIQRISQK